MHKGQIFDTEAKCKALTDELRPILQSSLNLAIEESKAKWDNGLHTYNGGSP